MGQRPYLRMRVAMVRCVIAIERYRLPEGVLPVSLEVLTPRWLAVEPEDPFSSEPLHYRQTDAGFVLYSNSQDFEDDGGHADSLRVYHGEDWGLQHCICVRVTQQLSRGHPAYDR